MWAGYHQSFPQGLITLGEVINSFWTAKLGDPGLGWQQNISHLVRMAWDCLPTITGLGCKHPWYPSNRCSFVEPSGLGTRWLLPRVPFLWLPVTYSQIYLKVEAVQCKTFKTMDFFGIQWPSAGMLVWLWGRFSHFWASVSPSVLWR